MKKFSWKKLSLTLLSASLIFGGLMLNQNLCGVTALKDDPENIPEASVTYTSEQTDPIVLSESSSVKLSGVTIIVDNPSSNTSAIKICNSSNVNLIFEGENVLSGNANLIGAGIYVEEGSAVTIYGLEGSSLNVTGGKYSAGIGGIGYTGANVTNPKAGEINIKSGSITAIGGARGAGIGSGYHSSVSKINISGGNITAIGTENSAGIGTGYGTSGGSVTASRVGFYNGGDITISGGIIKAASYNIDFTHLDPCNIQTLYTDAQGNAYSTGSFAAGIGGGYGASSGNIVINGSAEVTAVGGCGGAGIGSGRGTSKITNYDANNFFSNITIGGNSKVIAMATDDTRKNYFNGGGAAIGTGRGCDTAGTIKILDSANVTAVASPYAAAIGGSWKVGSVPVTDGVLNENASNMFALPTELEISPTATVSAVSDGSRSAISLPENFENTNIGSLLSLNFDSSFFESRSDYFTADKFPLAVEVLSHDLTETTRFSLYNSKKSNTMLYVPDTDVYYLKIKVIDANGEIIYLSNPVEDNSAQFKTPLSGTLNQYDITGLTSPLEAEGELETSEGNIKLKIKAPEGIFEYGSMFFCNKIQNQETIDQLNSNLDKKYASVLKHIIYFDAGVKDHTGETVYHVLKGGNAELYVSIPNSWDKSAVKAVFITEGEDEDFESLQKLETIDNIDYLEFPVTYFSVYALFDVDSAMAVAPGAQNGGEGETPNEKVTVSETVSSFVATGENFLKIACAALLMGTALAVYLIIKKKRKQ